MATSPVKTAKEKNANRGPVKPCSFYLIDKGQLEGDPTVTFDKEVAMDTLLKANEAGDMSLKMRKLTVPKGTRAKDAPVDAVKPPAGV